LRQSKKTHDDTEDADDSDLSTSSLEHRELIDNSRHHGLDHRELAVNTECEQHDEEQDGPERRDRHHCYAFGVRHER